MTAATASRTCMYANKVFIVFHLVVVNLSSGLLFYYYTLNRHIHNKLL